MQTTVLGESILVDRFPYDGEPIVWPVTLADIKLHAQIPHSADDPLLTFGTGGYLAAATEGIEARGQVSLIYQKRKLVLSELPCDQAVHVIRGPLVSVSSITYLDADDEEQVLDPVYYRSLAAGRGSAVYFKSTTSGITVADGPGVVTINMVCGIGDHPDKVPAQWRQLVAELAAFLWERRDGVAGGGIDEAFERVLTRKVSMAGGSKRYV